MFDELNFTTENIISISISLISLFGIIVTTIYTNYTTKKISKYTIDANLIASARIEWIQNVRKTTAELISAYYDLLGRFSITTANEQIATVVEKSELLLLYFGPENISNTNNSSEAELTDINDNIGKNEKIVKEIINLKNFFDTDYQALLIKMGTKLHECSDLKDKLDVLNGDITNNANTEPINPSHINNLKQQLLSCEEEIEEINKKVWQVKKSIAKLRDVIRIYLKIEWNIAKSHK